MIRLAQTPMPDGMSLVDREAVAEYLPMEIKAAMLERMDGENQNMVQLQHAVEQLGQQLQQVAQQSEQADIEIMKTVQEITTAIEKINEQIIQLQGKHDKIESERMKEERENKIKDDAYNRGYTDAEKIMSGENDPVKLKTYQNEVNACYFTPKTGNVNISLIESKKGGYFHKGNPIYLPDDVLLLSFGADTQDNGFYYIFVGWCFGMVLKILKHGFIYCDMKEQQYKDVSNVFIKFYNEISTDKMLWQDNSEAWFSCGFIDRGGHRSEQVDYICSKIPNLFAYVGLTKPDSKQSLFYESKNGPFFLGQTELISKITGSIIDSSDFYIPDDFHPELCRQLARQYFIQKKLPDGSEVEKWIHGGDDHFRDCLNLAYIAGIKKSLIKYYWTSRLAKLFIQTENNYQIQPKVYYLNKITISET